MPPLKCTRLKSGMFVPILLMFWAMPISAQLDISFDVDEPSCNGFTNGNITAHVMGGTTPYSFLWSNFQSGPIVYGINAGTWSVTVTDAAGLSSDASVTVGEPPLLETMIEPAGDICLGTDGDLTANTTGGTPPYSFMWSTGETTQTISDLVVGFYIVTVTDANGCKATHGAAVNSPLSVTVKATDVICYGWCDGIVEAMVMGGTGPYTYLWNTGHTDPIIDMLPPGTYTVTVTDSNGCTATGTGVINEPPPVVCTIDITGQCTSNINVSVSASGGVGPLTYQWAHGPTTPNLTGLSDGYYYLTVTSNGICQKDTFIVVSDGVEINPIPTPAGCNGTPGSVIVEVPNGEGPLIWILTDPSGITSSYSDKFITGLSAGTYTVQVIDAAGCSATTTFEIENAGNIDVTVNTTNSGCGTACTGSASVTASGGTPPYTYEWSAGTQNGNNATDLCPGNYSVTVTDADNCQKIVDFTIGQDSSNMVLATSSTPSNCGTACDGTATVMVVSGGVIPLTYQWDSAAGNSANSSVTDLCPGTYSVTVSDGLGCTAVASVTVDEIPTDMELSVSVTPAGCGSNCDGTATVNVNSGGTAPFTYQWDANAGNQTTQTAVGLCSGTYSVTVYDFNNCQKEIMATVPDSPSALTLEFDIKPATCGGICDGEATAIVSGGDAPYSYQWDANANNQTTQTAVGLCVGDYSVTVTDSLGCKVSGTTTITEADPILVELKITDATCHNTADGCVEITNIFPNSNPPYSIEWSTGETDTTEICGLLPGDYDVTVTDSLGCEAIVPFTVSSESSVDAQFDWQVDTCRGDSILVTFTDASVVDPATDVIIVWEWIFSTGDTSDMSSVSIWITDPTIDVTLIVENTSGCLDTIMETVEINLFNCTFPASDTTVCQGDELILMLACPADSTLNFVWSPADKITDGQNTNTATIDTSEPGEFDVWVDISSTTGCASSDTIHVTVVDTSLAQIDTSLISYEQSCDTLEICFENLNDSLAFSIYTWYFDYPNDDYKADSLSPCFIYPAPGNYTVALVPNAECYDTLMIDITVHEQPMADFDFDMGDCSDTVIVKFNDKSVPDDITSWYWDFGNGLTSDEQNPETFYTDTVTGTKIFIVTQVVTFENGCVDTMIQEIPIDFFVPEFPNDTVVSCGPGMPVELNPNGDSTYTYMWTPGSELTPNPTYWNPTAMPNDPTTYTAQIDSANCSVTRLVSVIFSDSLNLTVMPDTLELCEEQIATLTANSTNSTADFTWYDDIDLMNEISDSNTVEILVADPKDYYVVVTDEYGCSQTENVFTGNFEINVSMEGEVDICPDEMVDSVLTDIQPDYTVTWTPFDPTGWEPSDTATFFVTITNPQGCEFDSSLFVDYANVDSILNVQPPLDTIVLGDRVQITATDLPTLIYDWDNEQYLSQDGVPNPIAFPEEIGLTTFTLNAEHIPTGCRGSGEATICVISDLCDYPMIFFPNAFTPNGDDNNDVLFVEGLNIDEVFFAIYNRWGEKVFESHSQDEGWDGTFNGEPASGDVFAYYLRVRCAQGGELKKQGNITVIR